MPNSEVFESVLTDSAIDDEFTMSDFVPKYSYLILELNTEYKRLVKEFKEIAAKLKTIQSHSVSQIPQPEQRDL